MGKKRFRLKKHDVLVLWLTELFLLKSAFMVVRKAYISLIFHINYK